MEAQLVLRTIERLEARGEDLWILERSDTKLVLELPGFSPLRLYRATCECTTETEILIEICIGECYAPERPCEIDHFVQRLNRTYEATKYPEEGSFGRRRRDSAIVYRLPFHTTERDISPAGLARLFCSIAFDCEMARSPITSFLRGEEVSESTIEFAFRDVPLLDGEELAKPH